MALANEIRLIGYCGAEPKIKDYYNGYKICILPIYTEHWVVDYQTKREKRFKELHWCVFRGSNAERAKKLLMKGSQVHISGAMHYHKVKNNNIEKTYPQVMVEEFMITTKAMVTKELYENIMRTGKAD